MIPNTASPFLGGIVFRLLRALGVQDEALVRLRRASALLLPLITWLPLFVLSAAGGKLLAGSVATPFLLDLSAHIRLLVALPLFLIGARVAEVRLLPTIHQFLTRRLIPEKLVDKFDGAVNSAFRLGDSVIIDILIIVAVYVLDTLVVWRAYAAPHEASWYAGSSAQGSPLTPAGIYYAYLSLPVFQFILFRWYVRLLLWARFLAQVARLDLQLVPTNPDRVGGLGFLISGTQAFAVFVMAHGALLAGWLAARVVVRGIPLTEFKGETIAVVVFVLCITIAPLAVFTPPLMRTKRRGILEYGALATRYAREFDGKWVHTEKDAGEPLVGSADIQSLADMGGSYDIVAGMRNVPITPQMVLGFAAATLVPVAPLLLTLMPLSEILNKLVGVLF